MSAKNRAEFERRRHNKDIKRKRKLAATQKDQSAISRGKQAPPPPNTKNLPRYLSDHLPKEVIQISFSNRWAMRTVGPILPAEIHLRPDYIQLIQKAGQSAPIPVKGWFIIDTGASDSAVAEHAIAHFGIHPISVKQTHGVHGAGDVNIYPLDIRLKRTPDEKTTWMRRVDNIAAINLDAPFVHALEKNDGIKIIGLIGRDFLDQVVFISDPERQSMIILNGPIPN